MRLSVWGPALVLTLLLLASTASATDMLSQVNAAHDPVSNTYLVARRGDTPNLEVYRVDAAGRMLGTKTSLKDGNVNFTDVAYDSETGRFLVLWSEVVYSGGSGEWSIRGRFITTAGTADGDEITFVNSLTTQPNARVEYSAHTERFFIAYCTNTAIRGQFAAADGTLDGAAFDVIPGDTDSGFQYPLNVEAKVDSVNHRFLVVGTYRAGGYPPLRMFGAIVDDADPVTFTAERFTVLHSTTYIYPPALAFDTTNERFLVAYEVYTGSGHQVEGVRVNADGTLEGGIVSIHDGRTASFATAVTYKPADDRFLVVWLDDRSSNFGVTLYGQEVNADGTLYATEYQVASRSYQYDLALAHNAVEGNTLVAYGGYQQDHVLITPPPPVADLQVAVSAPEQCLVGETVEYVVRVAHLGGDDAHATVLHVELPSAGTFHSAVLSQGILDIDGTAITGTLDTLSSGATVTLTILMVLPSAGGHMVAASVESKAVDTTPANDADVASVSAKEFFAISPTRLTTGFEVEIRGRNLGEKKGKVKLVGEDGKKKKLKVLSWNEGDSGVILVLMKKAPRSGHYSLAVKLKGEDEILEMDSFEVVDPLVQQYPTKVYGSQELGLTGHWFGTKKGKLYLEYEKNGKTKRTSLKVLMWPETQADGFEDGEIRFRMPKKLPIGPARLVVRTKAGEHSVPTECREAG